MLNGVQEKRVETSTKLKRKRGKPKGYIYPVVKLRTKSHVRIDKRTTHHEESLTKHSLVSPRIILVCVVSGTKETTAA